jgi:hypothetical protein
MFSMSHQQSTTVQHLAQQFEAHLTEMEPFLVNWGNTTFSHLDEATRNEALQRTRITLWTRYQTNPAEFEKKPPRRFTQYAKTIYAHSLYGKKERVINRRFVQAGDIGGDDLHDGDLDPLDLVSLPSGIRHAKRETRELRLAETRIDLQRAIAKGMRTLSPEDQADMRRLMTGTMEGYSVKEMREAYGWNYRRYAQLKTILQTTFYEALTGETRETAPKQTASEADLTELARLYDLELSAYRIGPRLGRSQAWALHHIEQLVEKRRQAARESLHRAVDHLAEGIHWHRDDDDLADIMTPGNETTS